jgi:hypothetical protein
VTRNVIDVMTAGRQRPGGRLKTPTDGSGGATAHERVAYLLELANRGQPGKLVIRWLTPATWRQYFRASPADKTSSPAR